MREFVLSYGFIFFAAVIDVIAVIIIKLRLNVLGPVKFDGFYNTVQYCISVISTAQSFLATLGIVLSPILYGFALSRINLSSAYPLVVAFSAISLVLCSYLILKEAISFKQLLGIATILLGVALIYWK